MRLKVAIVFALTVSVALACHADSLLTYKLDYCTGANQKSLVIAGVDGATAGNDNEQPLGSPSSTAVVMAVHKTAETNGWNGDTGFYLSDARQTLAPGGSVTVENVYLWAGPDAPQGDLHVGLYPQPFVESGLTYKLTLVSVPSGVTYSGPTEWGINDKLITLPFYSTSDGTTGYKFKIEITAAQ